MEIAGKVVVVTGGAGGIGLAIARRFALGGSRVVLMDVNPVALAQAAQEIPGDVFTVEADVAEEQSVIAAFDRVVEHCGGVDVAVLNAGILRDGLLVKVDRETGAVKTTMSLKQWQAVIDVNLTGIFLTGREAASRMVEQKKGGVLVLMSSIARFGNFGQSNYSAAKAGVTALATVWGRELSRYGIRVGSVSPGLIGTPMVLRDMKQEMLEKARKRIPVGRLGTPDEVAHAVQFVVENDMISASDVEPSGGMRF